MTKLNATPAPLTVGQTVYAEDGEVGRIEEIIRGESAEPRYAIVTVRRGLRRRRPVVPCELVTRTDARSEAVFVRGQRSLITSLSESIPLLG